MAIQSGFGQLSQSPVLPVIGPLVWADNLLVSSTPSGTGVEALDLAIVLGSMS